MSERARSTLHHDAAVGFDAEAAAYARARPTYPGLAVGWLAAEMAIGPGRRVVDLAAGTGKLTGLLAAYDADLVAIEPVPGMRTQLRRLYPDIAVLAGLAEALPLTDGSVDAVTVAQAFHWFDPDRAMVELARVIRPGGSLGLVWNSADRSIEWVERIWSVMDRVEREAPWAQDGPTKQQRWRGDELVARGPWTAFTKATFSQVQQLTHDQVVDRIVSVSHVAALPSTSQQQVLAEVRDILDASDETAGRPLVDLPYVVDAMITWRTASTG